MREMRIELHPRQRSPQAALRNRNSSFVLDGESVLLGVDGRSDFDALHSRRHDAEVEFYAFDILVSDGEDLRGLPLSMRKASLSRLLARHVDGLFLSDFEQGEIGPDLYCLQMGTCFSPNSWRVISRICPSQLSYSDWDTSRDAALSLSVLWRQNSPVPGIVDFDTSDARPAERPAHQSRSPLRDTSAGR
jgi:ATP dependent DNA ligase domain